MTHRPQKALERLIGFYTRSHQIRWAMMSQVVTSGANFATALIIVRSLGLAEFGRFSVCFLLMMIVRNFLNGTVLAPMSTIAPKLRAPTRAPYDGFLIANGLAFALGSSLLLFAFAAPLGTVLNAPWLPELALAFALATVTANAADFVRRYHFVYEAPVWAFTVDAVRFVVQLVLLLVLAFRAEFSSETALYALAGGSLAGIAAGAPNFRRPAWNRRLNRAVWPRHWNFVKWMTPNVALEAVQSSGVLLIGGALLGETALGGVRAMQNLANTVNLPFNALQQIAPSLASRAYQQDGPAGMRRFLSAMTVWSLVVVGLIMACVVAFADLLIHGLFYVSVGENLPTLLLFCMMNGLIALRFPITVGLQSVEQPVILLWGGIAGALIGTLGVLALAPLLGHVSIPVTGVSVVAGSLLILALLSRGHLGTMDKAMGQAPQAESMGRKWRADW